MSKKRILAAAMSFCMAAPMCALMAPASVSADITIMGDANNDGEFTIADAVMTQKWILGSGELTNWENVDFCKDNVIDIFDLNLLCKELVKQGAVLPPGLSAVNVSNDIKSSQVDGAKADSEFVLSQTEFALELMKREIKDGENTLISPYSVMQALAMTTNGADGETKAEMEKALGGMSIEKLNEYLYTWRESQPNSEKCKLSTANSIWSKVDDELLFNQDFLQKNADYYNADIFKAPFDKTTVDDINNWVNEKTDKMIPKLLEEISNDSIMFLINAVAFDAKWMEPYTENDVYDSYFTSSDGTVNTAHIMASTEYTYLHGENAEGFMKYYDGGRYAFAALLPDEGIALSDYVNSLTPQEFNRIISEPEMTAIYTELPKFKYDFDTELNKTLKDMGMNSAFYEGADFSKMVNICCHIDSVLHKTHIEVDEEGTKAAAVTSVGIVGDCAPIIPEKEIILNRPFLYAIVDTETSLPVFIGTLDQPAE